MARTTYAVPSRRRRKKILKQASGFRGSRSKLLRQAYNAVDHAMIMAYVGRKQKKQQYRRLWTVRINAACRAAGMNYSVFMHGLKCAGIEVNRKMLAEMAVNDAESFAKLIESAKTATPAVKS